ncbi:hypothetical protein NDU88_009547 [Pleurodeles waltl]|uniref:Uncharacterized protein n=1 Tax=Pleurodeles waltl TaxID=8319 RepID=A0AAV7PXI6_PLEWA|nr:hypothetical protein NDU88_009547 [Pleurodeles waltl]
MDRNAVLWGGTNHSTQRASHPGGSGSLVGHLQRCTGYALPERRAPRLGTLRLLYYLQRRHSAFAANYSTLYGSDAAGPPEDLYQFVEDVRVLCLSPEDRGSLEAEVTCEELRRL